MILQKKTLVLVLSCALFHTVANADTNNTITFQGQIVAQTCEVTVNGATNAIVMLPTVPLSTLSGAAGKTAGLTPFTISITNCTASSSSDTSISTNFLGHNVDANGVLTNTASSNASTGVGIQITGTSSGTNVINLNGVTSVAGLVLKQNETSATHDFGAQYYSLSASPTAGDILAVMEYTLDYF